MVCNLLSIAVILVFLSIYGCETEPEPREWTQPQIQVLMAPEFTQQVPTKVELSVTDAEGTHIFDNPRRPGERAFSFNIEVLPGDVTISLTMTFEDGASVTDTKQTKITPERNIINFSLDEPNQLAVGIDSDETFPIRRNDEFSITLLKLNFAGQLTPLQIRVSGGIVF